MDAVAADTALDADARAAVADGDVAVLVGDNACGVHAGGLDGAVDVQVLNRAAVHVAEGGHAVFAAAVADGEGVAAAIEGALEFMASRARHAGDGDVVVETDGLAAGAVVGDIVGQQVAEHAPALGGVDGVLVAALGEVHRVGDERDGDVVVGHDEGGTGQFGVGDVGAIDSLGDGVGVGHVALGVSGRAGEGDGRADYIVVGVTFTDDGRTVGGDALADIDGIDYLYNLQSNNAVFTAVDVGFRNSI